MRIQGTLTQSAADATAIAVHATGARQSQFTAAKLLAIYLEMPSAIVRAWTTVSTLVYVTVTGLTSGQQLVWEFAIAGGLNFDCTKTYYLPPGLPEVLNFDEEVQVRIVTAGTGQSNTLNYKIIYEIVQSDELTMVKTIGNY
jgi:hypothetical protein